MERLTARTPGGNAFFPHCFEEPCGGGGCTMDHCEFLDQVCEKLARYEEQADRQLAESEAARAELGRRLAAAEQELHDTKSEIEAAVRDLLGQCSACEHVDTDCPAMDCRHGEKFRRHGPKKEA